MNFVYDPSGDVIVDNNEFDAFAQELSTTHRKYNNEVRTMINVVLEESQIFPPALHSDLGVLANTIAYRELNFPPIDYDSDGESEYDSDSDSDYDSDEEEDENNYENGAPMILNNQGPDAYDEEEEEENNEDDEEDLNYLENLNEDEEYTSDEEDYSSDEDY